MNTSRRPQQSSQLLRELLDGGVEFALVGGVAAIIHGATRMTSDVDIAMPFAPENLERFRRALHAYKPVHATRPELSLLDEPLSRLAGFRLLLVETDLGRIDALRDVAPLGSFGQLATVEREVFGRTCRVLSLDALIEVKLYVARPKDLEVARELMAIRERLSVPEH